MAVVTDGNERFERMPGVAVVDNRTLGDELSGVPVRSIRGLAIPGLTASQLYARPCAWTLYAEPGDGLTAVPVR